MKISVSEPKWRASNQYVPVTPLSRLSGNLVQTPNCRSGTGRTAGPGTYEHLLCQCVRRPVLMVSGLAGWRPRPGMTSFFDFVTASKAGIQPYQGLMDSGSSLRYGRHDDFHGWPAFVSTLLAETYSLLETD
jgi:hypothetical protein